MKTFPNSIITHLSTFFKCFLRKHLVFARVFRFLGLKRNNSLTFLSVQVWNTRYCCFVENVCFKGNSKPFNNTLLLWVYLFGWQQKSLIIALSPISFLMFKHTFSCQVHSKFCPLVNSRYTTWKKTKIFSG